MSRLSSSPPIAATLLFLLALALRVFWALYYQFDGLYGQDAYAYYQYARDVYNALAHFQPPPPFWWPLGYPALLVPAFALGGHETPFAQHLTILCGALIAPLAYALTREASPSAYKNAAGWVAGLLCAFGGQAVQSSVVIMADIPALMWATLAAWLLLRYTSTRRILTLSLAALAVGLAVWTRWQNLIFAAVWFAAWLAAQFVPARQRLTTSALHGVLALALITLVLVPQLLATTSASAPLAGSSWLENWHPQNALLTSFDTVDGHFDYPLPVALFYAQVFAHPAYNVILLLPFFILGIYTLFKNLPSMLSAAILLPGWILAMYLFLAGIPYQNFRFPLGMYVPIAAVTGIGAGWLWHRWQTSRKRYLVIAWLALSLLLMLIWQPRVLAPVIATKTHELARMSTLHLYMGAGETIWTLGFSGALNNSVPVNARELWGITLDDIKSDRTSYLFIDVANIESQWAGRDPQILYHALRDANMLQQLAQLDGWTLYKIPPSP